MIQFDEDSLFFFQMGGHHRIQVPNLEVLYLIRLYFGGGDSLT